MTKLRIIPSIVVEEFLLTISIPMDARKMIVQYENIHAAEAAFASKYETAKKPGDKVNFERARALMKWGGSCKANLVGMKRQEDGRLHVTLEFTDKKDMDEFHKYLSSNVDGATRRIWNSNTNTRLTRNLAEKEVFFLLPHLKRCGRF